jgi:hypothetical protein
MYNLENHKNSVKQELTRRGLGGLLNDTKWCVIQSVMRSLPFPPPYQRKDILHNAPEGLGFDADVFYHGDWEEGIHPFFSIEWLRIRPRCLVHVARLLPPKVHDCELELIAALESASIAYEKRDDCIWIYGYR